MMKKKKLCVNFINKWQKCASLSKSAYTDVDAQMPYLLGVTSLKHISLSVCRMNERAPHVSGGGRIRLSRSSNTTIYSCPALTMLLKYVSVICKITVSKVFNAIMAPISDYMWYYQITIADALKRMTVGDWVGGGGAHFKGIVQYFGKYARSLLAKS